MVQAMSAFVWFTVTQLFIHRNSTTRTSTSPSTLTIRIPTPPSPPSLPCGPFSPTNRIDSPTTSRTISTTSIDAILTSHMSSASSIVPAELGQDIAELPVSVDAVDDFLDRGTAMLREGGASTQCASHDGHVFPVSFERSHCVYQVGQQVFFFLQLQYAHLGNMFPTKRRIAAPRPNRLNRLV